MTEPTTPGEGVARPQGLSLFISVSGGFECFMSRADSPALLREGGLRRLTGTDGDGLRTPERRPFG